MKLNWNFLGGEGVQNKKPSVGGGGVWIFSGTTQYIHVACCIHVYVHLPDSTVFN